MGVGDLLRDGRSFTARKARSMGGTVGRSFSRTREKLHGLLVPSQPGVREVRVTTTPVDDMPGEPVDIDTLRDQVVWALKTVYDPEIPVNIWDLGLIYGVNLDAAGRVAIDMTLTSPNCPVAESLPLQVKHRVLDIPAVSAVKLELTWDPPWSYERMSEAARLELGFM